MSTGGQPTEEELRAAYEAELKQIRVEQIVLEQVVSLVNLGMRRTGLAPGTEDERDVAQVRVAIEAVRALMPVIEQTAPRQASAVRDALSQLQLAFVRIGGSPGAEAAGGAGVPGAGGPSGPGAGGPGAGGPGGPGPERAGGAPPSGGGSPTPPAPEPPKPGEPGPAQRSGRLWVPGQ